jgi:hypothetical protein
MRPASQPCGFMGRIPAGILREWVRTRDELPEDRHAEGGYMIRGNPDHLRRLAGRSSAALPSVEAGRATGTERVFRGPVAPKQGLWSSAGLAPLERSRDEVLSVGE